MRKLRVKHWYCTSETLVLYQRNAGTVSGKCMAQVVIRAIEVHLAVWSDTMAIRTSVSQAGRRNSMVHEGGCEPLGASRRDHRGYAAS